MDLPSAGLKQAAAESENNSAGRKRRGGVARCECAVFAQATRYLIERKLLMSLDIRLPQSKNGQ